MKKNLFKVLSLMLVALMAMTVVGSAASIAREVDGTTVTVTVSGVGSGDEVTLLAVPAGLALDEIDLTDEDTANDIVYIDQVTANGNVATFTFTTDVAKYDLYSGFSTMNVAEGALSDLAPAGGEEGGEGGDDPVTPPVVEAPEVETAQLVKANAFDLAGFSRIFVKLAEGENGVWMPVHSDEESTIYYSTEREGYDGLVKTSAAAIADILAEITWEKVAPTADQTIAKYGDMKADNKINALDTAQFKKLVKRINAGTPSANKDYILADVNGDNKANALDAAQIKKYIKAVNAGDTYAFPVLSK